MLFATLLPPDLHVSVTSDSLLVDSDGRVISTARVCPGYQFVTFGASGPKFSPNQHWILVDVRGPFTPGNVERNRALVHVASGALIASPDFPKYAGVPSTLDALAWASGERATLRYANGKTARVAEPPLHPFPAQRCASERAG